jgi:hypothetical protein
MIMIGLKSYLRNNNTEQVYFICNSCSSSILVIRLIVVTWKQIAFDILMLALSLTLVANIIYIAI